jgi:WD repeat-containing protein 35
VNKLQ